MIVKDIVLEFARLALVEFEDGRNSLAVLVESQIKGRVEDAAHWAGALIGVVELAVNSVPESDQLVFEKIMLDKFRDLVENREETVLRGEIGKELE